MITPEMADHLPFYGLGLFWAVVFAVLGYHIRGELRELRKAANLRHVKPLAGVGSGVEAVRPANAEDTAEVATRRGSAVFRGKPTATEG